MNQSVNEALSSPRAYPTHQCVSFSADSECVYSPLDPPNSVLPLAHMCTASSRSHVTSAPSACRPPAPSFNEFRLLRFSAAQEGSRRVASSVSSGPDQRIPLRDRHDRHVAPLLQLWLTLAARGLRRQYLAAGFAQHTALLRYLACVATIVLLFFSLRAVGRLITISALSWTRSCL